MEKKVKNAINKVMYDYNEREYERIKAYLDAWCITVKTVDKIEKEQIKSLDYLYDFQHKVSEDILKIYYILRENER